jgi:hypothetical protein
MHPREAHLVVLMTLSEILRQKKRRKLESLRQI